MPPRMSDEDVGRQILGIFMRYRVVAGGTLRRNNFFDVRDADFQRGLNFAIASKWIKQHLRDRYTYQLTEAGFAAGWKPEPRIETRSEAAAAPKPAEIASEPLQPAAEQPDAVTMAPQSPDPVEDEPIPTAPTDQGPADPWKSPV